MALATKTSIKDLIMDDIEDDTYILGTLLSIKKANNSRMLFKKFNSGAGASKKGRFDAEASYYRLLMFRETSSASGKCFVMLCKNAHEFSDLSYDGMTIGDVMVIFEPFFEGNYLSSFCDLPIFKSTVPKESRLMTADDLRRAGPIETSDIVKPPMGHTLSFRMEGVDIKVKRAVLKQSKSNCTGTLCDRQKEDTCACVYGDHRSFKHVLELMVKIPGNASFITFRSLYLTKITVVVDSLRDQSEHTIESPEVRVRMRNKLKSLVAFVNSKEGWNIVGWTRTGEKVDQADGTTKIISDTIAPHIVRMEPKGSYDLKPHMFDFCAPTTSIAPNEDRPRNHGDATAARGVPNDKRTRNHGDAMAAMGLPSEKRPRNHGDATTATGHCDNDGSEKAFADGAVGTTDDL